MSEIMLRNDLPVLSTQIPNYFIDHFMVSANGEFVKIYLFLLRCVNQADSSFSISKAADRFEYTEKDIHRALKYWEKMGLLRLEYNGNENISGIYFLDILAETGHLHSDTVKEAPDSQTKASEQPPPSKISSSSKPPEAKNYTTDELKAFQEKEDIQELIFITEQYLGRILTSTDVQTILFWYDQLNFRLDLIEYLIEYCVGKGHKSMHYMNKVAVSWSNSKVKTIEDAKKNSYEYSKTHYAVMKALGITGRSLISAEISYIDKWSKTLAFTDDIITEACKRTIMTVHRPSFDYADSILVNWHKSKIRHLADISRIDENHVKSKAPPAQKTAATNKFNNFSQRNYDFERLEKQLIDSTNH